MALDQQTGMRVVSMVWIGAIAGIIQTVFARGAAGSKVISAVLYVALGWIVLPYAGQLKQSLDPVSINLIVAGGIIYSLGVSGETRFSTIGSETATCQSEL